MTHNKDVTSRQIIVDHTHVPKKISLRLCVENKRLSNIKPNVVATDVPETKYFARRQPYLHFHYLIVMQFLQKHADCAFIDTSFLRDVRIAKHTDTQITTRWRRKYIFLREKYNTFCYKIM